MSYGIREIDMTTIHYKSYSEQQPWPKLKLKGKPILVNDTFVRVDETPSYIVRSQALGRYPIDVESSMGKAVLPPGSCQGHILVPDFEHTTVGSNLPPRWLKSRCMTAQEIAEAREDYILARPIQGDQKLDRKEIIAEYINVPGKAKDHGDADGGLRLQAFNKALHQRRLEIAAKMAQRGLKWDYAKFFSATYDADKMSEMFRKPVPPPPSELKTGRENLS